jgi:hypothetical protein
MVLYMGLETLYFVQYILFDTRLISNHGDNGSVSRAQPCQPSEFYND